MPPAFKTSDYGLAGYLFALDFSYSRIENSDSEVTFCFPSDPGLIEAISNYSSNTPVKCRDFFHGLRKAKAIIREYTNGTLRKP